MKGQSEIVLRTIEKCSEPVTCQELCFACGFDPIESKNVSAILASLLKQNLVQQCDKRRCMKTGRNSTTYQKKNEHVSLPENVHKLDLGGGKSIHIIIKVA